MVTTLIATFLLFFVSSSIMYYLENEVQPDLFPNIIESFWWAIATLTTIGYGDVFPVTGWGKLMSGFIAILGIGLVALPTGIISSSFIKMINKKQDQVTCPHCGKDIHGE